MWKSLIDGFVEIGKVSGAAGVKGEMKLYHYSGERERLAGIMEFFLESGNGLEPYHVESIRYVGAKNRPIMKLARIADRDSAEALVGSRVFVRQEDLPSLDADSYYVEDLVGAEAHGPDGTPLGVVKEIIDNPANDILVIEGADGGFMIPFVDVFIRSVESDGDGKPARLAIEIPDGLREAYRR